MGRSLHNRLSFARPPKDLLLSFVTWSSHLSWSSSVTPTEIEIMCCHWSNSVRFITMTNHKCKWSVGEREKPKKKALHVSRTSSTIVFLVQYSITTSSPSTFPLSESHPSESYKKAGNRETQGDLDTTPQLCSGWIPWWSPWSCMLDQGPHCALTNGQSVERREVQNTLALWNNSLSGLFCAASGEHAMVWERGYTFHHYQMIFHPRGKMGVVTVVLTSLCMCL